MAKIDDLRIAKELGISIDFVNAIQIRETEVPEIIAEFPKRSKSYFMRGKKVQRCKTCGHKVNKVPCLICKVRSKTIK